jgi:uncharacterized protein (DUF1501 family)
MLNRRLWLQSALVAAPLWAAGTRLWAGDRDLPRFLLVFLRGGYDAQSLLVPYASPFYYEARPNIAIPKPNADDPKAAQALDADWALAPSAVESLQPLWLRRHMAFIPFAGSEDLSRSHFETQDNFELGQPMGGGRNFRSGFMNRLAQAIGVRNEAGSEALAFTDQVPLSFQGEMRVASQSLRNLSRSNLDERQTDTLRRMYAGTPLASAVDDGFETRSEVLREMGEEMDKASRNAIGSKGFEAEARRIGRLMRERIALGFVDVGGWDTHVAQGGTIGGLATRLSELSVGLAAFANEIGPQWKNTMVVVASEFGRTFRENGNRGTDHGHGTTYWVMGGAIRGGRVVGEQQALRADTLFQGRDTPVLNEYRRVLAGLWARQYGLSPSALDSVFSGVRPVDLGLV